MKKTLLLAEKVYAPFTAEEFQPIFKSLTKGLKVGIKSLDKVGDGWIQIGIKGEDETVASNLLSREFHSIPYSADNVTKYSTWRGKILSSTEKAVNVDVGIVHPKQLTVGVNLRTLQTQLADGKTLTMKELQNLFCLHRNLPLKVKVNSIAPRNASIEAELPEEQYIQYRKWITTALDKIIILGAPLPQVEYAVKRSRHSRDIVNIETLGLLEYAATCKLGTDAVGLIPKLGYLLKTAKLAAFSPKRILEKSDRWLYADS